MGEKELYAFWKKHIDGAKLYRVYSEEYKEDIKKNGIDPKSNPYKSKYKDIKKLFKLLLWLEKKHSFDHRQDWGKKDLVTSEHIVNCTLNDMKRKYIDFTPYQKEVDYYKRLMVGNGGALCSTVQKITRDIMERKPSLPTLFPKNIISELHNWTIKKGAFDIGLLSIKGSAKCFESAVFQNKLGVGFYLKSPFGSFEHFKKVVSEEGIEKYKHFFEENVWFNIRVTKRIDPKDIVFL